MSLGLGLGLRVGVGDDDDGGGRGDGLVGWVGSRGRLGRGGWLSGEGVVVMAMVTVKVGEGEGKKGVGGCFFFAVVMVVLPVVPLAATFWSPCLCPCLCLARVLPGAARAPFRAVRLSGPRSFRAFRVRARRRGLCTISALFSGGCRSSCALALVQV